MVLRNIPAMLLIVALLFVIGCSSHTHTIGYGPAFYRTEVQRQWYLLYELIPINEVDSRAMADSRRNYEITTQITVLDWIYMGVLAPMTFTYPRTVEELKALFASQAPTC